MSFSGSENLSAMIICSALTSGSISTRQDSAGLHMLPIRKNTFFSSLCHSTYAKHLGGGGLGG